MATSDERIIRDKKGFTSPRITVVDWQGRPALLKDYGKKNIITRSLFAPVSVRREFRILKRLEGIRGIPRPIKIVNNNALLMEYIEGKHVGKFGPSGLPVKVYERLVAVVEAMHARGVVHLDLRQRKNVLIAEDLQPWIVDFTNALEIGPRSPLRPFLGMLTDVDRSGLLKFKHRYFSAAVTPEEREFLRRHHFLRRWWLFKPHKHRNKDTAWE